jgi:iron(III) transport system substrate-binding protein
MIKPCIAALALALLDRPAARAIRPPELIEAARKEGKLVFYSANVAESETPVLNAFNKRFPFIKVEFLRAPGNQLLQRVKTEAAAGKLLADVIDHSDRALMLEIENLFQDYKPPNAADYIPEARVSPKLWPRSTVVWAIAYNSELVKNPPKTWMDLTKPEYGNKQIGNVIAPSAERTWTRAMFERQVSPPTTGRSRPRRSRCCFLPTAPTSDALVRGENPCRGAALQRDLPEAEGRRTGEGVLRAGRRADHAVLGRHPEDRRHPNAARLFLNWCLSEEGPGDDDPGHRQPHLAEEGARSIRRLRSGQGEGVGAELRSSS